MLATAHLYSDVMTTVMTNNEGVMSSSPGKTSYCFAWLV